MAKDDNVKQHSGHVFVGCRLPHGLNLQLTEMREEREPVLGGGMRSFKIHRRTEHAIKVHGIALAHGQVPKYPIVNGAAVTKVPAEFWNKWLEQNQTSMVVKNQMIFAMDSMDSARSKARELKGERTGQEPINPDKKAKDPRMKGVRTVPKEDAEQREENEEMEA